LLSTPSRSGARAAIPRRECRLQPDPQAELLDSPAGLAGVFVVLAAVVLAVGVAFAFAGAWLVLPFAGLEIAALVAAKERLRI
jgi:uncharacterized membrane protein